MADEPGYGTRNAAYVATFAGRDDEGPMWALNLMKYRDRAAAPVDRARGDDLRSGQLMKGHAGSTGTFADENELMALASGMRRAGSGVFEAIPAVEQMCTAGSDVVCRPGG